MVLNQGVIDDVPHIVRLGDGMTMLLAILGRSPMCLRCGFKGHMRNNCQAQPYEFFNRVMQRSIREEKKRRSEGDNVSEETWWRYLGEILLVLVPDLIDSM
ncbi:uncharacterized protein LOC124290685 [Haliotis rubra]|uniref:uncharacterized protein LOC124290685 n=1 Tax=Haliotis rubra TaxID=36100 RepID=UPI001EE587BE|nr:uncharacterized protein LOC124290685 [Haliotis rubra]